MQGQGHIGGIKLSMAAFQLPVTQEDIQRRTYTEGHTQEDIHRRTYTGGHTQGDIHRRTYTGRYM